MPPSTVQSSTASWIASANTLAEGASPIEQPRINIEARRFFKTTEGYELRAIGTLSWNQQNANRRPGKIVNVEKLLGSTDPQTILDASFDLDSDAFAQLPDEVIWQALADWAKLPAQRNMDAQDATMAARAVLLLTIRRAGGIVNSFNELPF